MNQRIDHNKVYWMLRTGFTPELVAQRLGCSRRQVDRITKREGWHDLPRPHLATFRIEHDLWVYYKLGYGETDAKIARRFGVSRQAVQQYFSP